MQQDRLCRVSHLSIYCLPCTPAGTRSWRNGHAAASSRRRPCEQLWRVSMQVYLEAFYAVVAALRLVVCQGWGPSVDVRRGGSWVGCGSGTVKPVVGRFLWSSAGSGESRSVLLRNAHDCSSSAPTVGCWNEERGSGTLGSPLTRLSARLALISSRSRSRGHRLFRHLQGYNSRYPKTPLVRDVRQCKA